MSKLALWPITALLLLALAGCGSGASGAAADAAVVNGHHISMATYSMQLTYKDRVSMESTGMVDVCKVKTFAAACTKLKQTVLNDLINEELVREWSARHHITVTKSDFTAQWASVMQTRFHNDRSVLRAWLKKFGLSEAALKGMVRDDLLQQRVMYAVTKSMPTSVPAVRLARIKVPDQRQLKVVDTMLKHQSFSTVAAALSSDRASLCASVGCGDLGWLPESFLPAQQRTAMAHLPIGSVVGPFADQQGLTLVKILGRTQHYHLNAQQSLAVRESLFTNWVQHLRQHASVQRRVAV